MASPWPGRGLQNLVLELRPSGASMDRYTTTPGLSGQFDFPQVAPGHYVLAILNQRGELLKEEYVSVAANRAEVTIRLGNRNPADGGGLVNAKQLTHSVPKAAQKAMSRYRKCRTRQDDTCAMREVQAALAADPEWVEAYVNRSALHVRAFAWDLALKDIQLALSLDPSCALAHSNRAFVAVYRKDYQQAAISARAALRSAPDSLAAQYLLGVAQVNLGDLKNGFSQLEKIADEYAPARAALAEAAPQRARLARIKKPAVQGLALIEGPR